MKNTEKLNSVIAANFGALANLAEINKDSAAWEDKDIEEIMVKYDLTAAEAVEVMKVMKNARYCANANAVKAADAGATAALKTLQDTGLSDAELEDLYNEIWAQIHKAIMPIEFKALAKVH